MKTTANLKGRFLNGRLISLQGQDADDSEIIIPQLGGNVVLDKFWSGMSEGGAANITFQVMRRVPFKAVAVRPVLYGSGAAITNFRASFAVTNTAANLNPVGGAFQQFTQGGSANMTIPAAIANAGTAQRIVAHAVGDWINAEMIERTDGGSGYLYILRGFTPNSNPSDIRAIALEDQGSVDVAGWRSHFQGGDITMNNAAGGLAPFNSWAPVAAEFATTGRICTVLAAGDSIVLGLKWGGAGPDAYVGPAVVAANGYKRTPVNVVQSGYGSQTSANFYTNAVNAVSRGGIDLAVIAAGSVNDAGYASAAWRLATLRMCAEWIRVCRQYGTRPGFITTLGQGAMSEAQEAIRRTTMNEVRAMAEEAGAIIVDRDAVLTNYASPIGGILAQYQQDGVHPNQAGINREAIEWQKAFDAAF